MAIHGRGPGLTDKLYAGAGKLFEIIIPIIIVLFVVVIIALFFIYRQSNQVEIISLEEQLRYTQDITERIEIQNKIDNIRDWWSQIWSFLETDAFKTMAVSVLLTALLAALGKVFKIKEAFEERIRTQRQNRIEAQKECIKQTEEMWEKLYCMVSEVRFYDKQQVEDFNNLPKLEIKDRKNTIVDILKQAENFASEAEDVVNKWHFVFPELVNMCEELNEKYRKEFKKKKKEWNKERKKKRKKVRDKKELEEINELIWKSRRPSELIVFFINVLYEATLSVAYFIRKFEKEENETANIEERTETLQNSLGVIQDFVKDRVHQYMLAILKCSVEPQEGYGDKKKQKINKENVEMYLDTLFDNCMKMRDEVHKFPILPSAPNEKIYEDYRCCRNMTIDGPVSEEAIKKANKVCNDLVADLDSIKGGEIAKYWEFKFSEETLVKLARRLGIVSSKEEINDRFRWDTVIGIEKIKSG